MLVLKNIPFSVIAQNTLRGISFFVIKIPMPAVTNISPWYQLFNGYDKVLSILQRKSILFCMTMCVLGITKGIMEASS